jgi:hypothetical protein
MASEDPEGATVSQFTPNLMSMCFGYYLQYPTRRGARGRLTGAGGWHMAYPAGGIPGYVIRRLAGESQEVLRAIGL